jgi:MerR family Zn(II)-responsive transcriptional regulator of zntA
MKSSSQQGPFKISATASLCGLSVDTLRFYDKTGLISPSHRSAVNARLYSAKDINTLKFIKRARENGLSLKEIQELLLIQKEGKSYDQPMMEFAEKKIEELNHRISDLQLLRQELQLVVKLCRSDTNNPMTSTHRISEKPQSLIKQRTPE